MSSDRFVIPSALALLLSLNAAPVRADINAVEDDVAGVNETTSPRRLQPEPTIAINPLDTRIIAAGAQDFRKTTELRNACGGNRWNGLYLSTDGGATWANSLVPGFCTDPDEGAGSEQLVSEMFDLSTNTDPVVAWDSFGNLYYSHIAFNDNPFRTTPPSASGVLFVSTYRDDGATYAKTVKVPSGSGLRQAPFEVGPGIVSNFDDKQWMTVDNTATSPFFGRLYVTWTKFGAQGGRSSIWLSSCGGDPSSSDPEDDVCEDFTRGKVINHPVPGGLVQESFPATGPDGELYVAFLQFQGGFGSTLPHSGVWILKSTDGGETFTQQQVTEIRQIPSPIPPTNPNAPPRANDGFNSFRTGTAPGVAVTDDGVVHLVWGEWIDNEHAEVMYARSEDDGESWSTPIPMNDDPTGHQFFPNIVADGDSVHVAWYDGRANEADDPLTDLHVFYNTFDPTTEPADSVDVQVTDLAFNPNEVSRFPVFCAAFIGDYIDIDAVDGQVAIIWNDNRTVTTPLTPAQCDNFITRPTDATIQGILDGGALDQDAFVEFNP
jgi:hypothetical protein